MTRHALEAVVDNPFRATPAQIIVALADPFDDLKLSESLRGDLIEVIERHFMHGTTLVQALSRELLSFDRIGDRFLPYKVQNAFELLSNVMSKRPDQLDRKLSYIYTNNVPAIEKIREAYLRWMQEGAPIDLDKTIDGVETRVLLLLHYTHQWHHFIDRKDTSGELPIKGPMTQTSRDNVNLWLRDDPNKGFPDYSSLGFQSRIKTFNPSVQHSVRRPLEILEEVNEQGGSKEDFYERIMAPYSRQEKPTIGTDFFGVKIFGSGRTIMGKTPLIQERVEGHLIRYGWEIVRYEDKRKSQDGLGPVMYLVRRKDGLTNVNEMSDVVQVQVVPLARFLLSDFFVRSHPVYHMRMQQHVTQLRQLYPDQYTRLINASTEGLRFLI